MRSSATNPWRVGLQAAQANLMPGIVLQLAAILLGCAFFLWPDFRALLDHVTRWQQAFGAPFAISSRMLFSGVIPYFVCLTMPAARPRHPAPDFLFGLILWGFMGFVTCYFYLLQGALYGNNHALLTVSLKLLTDMLLFTPFFACPLTSLAHLWRDNDYSWSRLRDLLRKGWYRRLILPSLIPNWIIWTPAVIVVYSLPLPLQVHISGLIGCFWSLMCLHIAGQLNRRAPTHPA